MLHVCIQIFLDNKAPKLAQFQLASEVKKKEGLRLRFYPWKRLKNLKKMAYLTQPE